jgi:hypothetical protein
LNDRKRAAFLADLAVLQRLDSSTRFEGEGRTQMETAEIRLREMAARGHPSGGGSGVSCSDVSDPTFRAAVAIAPTYERDRDELDHALSMAAFHVSLAARIVGRMVPVPALDDPPHSACNVLPCPNVPERLVKPKGSDIAVCGRCRKHFERHGRHWPIDRSGRDVRTTTGSTAA